MYILKCTFLYVAYITVRKGSNILGSPDNTNNTQLRNIMIRALLGGKSPKIAIILLASVLVFTAFMMESDESEAVLDSTIVAADIIALPDGGTYTFTEGDVDNVITLTIADNKNRIIDGDGFTFPANNGALHFNITNTGSGTITFINMTLSNPGGFASSGGIRLNGGIYFFENCSFNGLTNTGVTFIGNSNSAYFFDCSFTNNTKGITPSSGTPASQAVFNIDRCYFDGNVLTNGRGAAIGMNAEYVDLNISNSVFTNNKVPGTSNASGGNNAVDGGAVAVNANFAPAAHTVTLNIWDCYFEGNFAQDDGGAILVEGSGSVEKIHSNIWNCTFTGNTAAGAAYFATRTIGAFTITAGITNGSGGAISYYGLTNSTITNCTFYNNGILNSYTAQGGLGLNCGNVGGGGAIGVDTHDWITDPTLYPAPPVLSNNIFVGNYVNRATNYLLPEILAAWPGLEVSDNTANVFVFRGADADRTSTSSVRPLTNNGNIGYDAGLSPNFDRRNAANVNYMIIIRIASVADELGTHAASGLTVGNVFINTVAGVPVKEPLPVTVGAAGNQGQGFYFMPSPTSDELYRDGSGPYYDSNYTASDTLGNPRDLFPNAGSIEIYWTKFNPGLEGDWDTVPATIDNPKDVTKPFRTVKSLFFATNGMYYVATDVGLPSPEIVAMPRSALIPDDAQYGFVGWRSNQPDFGWWDAAWAAANGVTETNVYDFLLANPMSDLPKDAFPLYNPGQVVPSVKQTLTAEWKIFEYRVDFSLNYADPPVYPDPVHHYWLPAPGDITVGGYESAGAAIVVPPYTNVPFGDKIYQPKADPLRFDYVFKGWYKDAACTVLWNFASDTVETDIVLYAKWELLTFNVIYHNSGASGGVAPVDPASPYLPRTDVTVLGKGTLARSGFTFEGWSLLPGSAIPTYVEGDIFNINNDVDLYPVWKAVPGTGGGGGGTKDREAKIFYIYSSADGGATIDPLGTTSVTEGGSVTFTFSAKSGNKITAIIIDGTEYPGLIGSSTYTFSNVTRDHNISIVTSSAADPRDDLGTKGADWSVLNLIIAFIALIIGIGGLIHGRNRFTDIETEEKRRSKLAVTLRVLGLIGGIVSIVVFFLTEDWTLAITGTDEWTPLMVLLLVITVFVTFVSFHFDEKIE